MKEKFFLYNFHLPFHHHRQSGWSQQIDTAVPAPTVALTAALVLLVAVVIVAVAMAAEVAATPVPVQYFSRHFLYLTGDSILLALWIQDADFVRKYCRWVLKSTIILIFYMYQFYAIFCKNKIFSFAFVHRQFLKVMWAHKKTFFFSFSFQSLFW